MKKTLHIVCLLLSVWCVAVRTNAQAPFNVDFVVQYNIVASGFSSPVDIVHAGDSRLFVVEQTGQVKIWTGTSVLSTPFIDLASTIVSGGERGLLSLAFHPQYATNGYFFVYYNAAGTGNITIARYQVSTTNPNVANASSGVVLMSIPKPFTNHNGGKLLFGTDGYLYFGTGDGGSGGDPGNRAQDGTSNLGKLLRIDVNNFSTPPYYSIPPTNPYISNPNINDEIIAIGLRNPWRWSFDRLTGDMWLPDVGQDLYEEVNYRPGGSTLGLNYGWRCYEGSHVFDATCTTPLANQVNPIFEYGHDSNGGYSITGGFVYRGVNIITQGYYFFTDYVSRRMWLTKPNGSGGWKTTVETTLAPTNITTFGEDVSGELYVTGANGILYRIGAAVPLPVKLVAFTGRQQGQQHQLFWKVAAPKAGDQYILQRSKDRVQFEELETVAAIAGKTEYETSVNVPGADKWYYRLVLKSVEGGFTYSPTVAIGGNTKTADVKVYTSGKGIVVESGDAVIKSIAVCDWAGRVYKTEQPNVSGVWVIDAAGLPAGIWIVKLISQDGSLLIKKILR